MLYKELKEGGKAIVAQVSEELNVLKAKYEEETEAWEKKREELVAEKEREELVIVRPRKN